MSCNCTTNPCGCDSGVSLPYLTGATGNDGQFGGFSARWKFDSSTATSPASTYVRLNNATPSSVTQIYISDTNFDNVDHDSFLDSFSNSGSFGTIRIWKQFDSSKFWMGTVTAVTDNGTDHTLAVTHIQSNSTFTASDALIISFTNNGATGATGATGAAGANAAQVIDVDFSGSIATSTAGPVALSSLSIPANQLDTDKDYLEFTGFVTLTGSDNAVNSIYLSIGDQGRALDGGETFTLYKETGVKSFHVRGLVIRESALLAHCFTEITACYFANAGITLNPVDAASSLFNHQQIAIDWSQINLLEIGLDNVTSTNTITLQHFEVKHVQKV